MTNNDILRRLRFVFDLSNGKMIRLFAKVKFEMPEDELLSMMKKDDEPGFRPCTDVLLCRFLDGLIIEKRGLQPGAEIPKPTKLNNNLILRKLRIALEMREEDMIETLALADFKISKAEISALFRKPEHKHFKTCGDQILRNFIKGLSLKYRGK
ncbi:DUF1456 domain-containing protein [Shewanella sp. NFH-SH190041]|uniref:DUF1456 family protein n=1 Tax=Shewanella sp. NFH-SH190041 TaxID=2950245 RepID=UPI0021C46A5B|nr:DUF1456 family protein [Shewanella sp. NFH-SH190041]BDM65683.1 DUF1456 domain-containing protein [Shewanella sp. NFH-SH190041]